MNYTKKDCQYPVEAPGTIDGDADCGEPAPYFVWWEDPSRGLHVCEKHFKLMMSVEEGTWEGE